MSSLIVISCLAPLVPGVQREEMLPRASEVPALIGFVLVLENDPLICLPPPPKSEIQPSAWCMLDKHPTN